MNEAPRKSLKKILIIILRVFALVVLVVSIPPTVFGLSLTLEEKVTVNTIDDEGYAFLAKEFDVLKNLPDNSTIDQVIYYVAPFPSRYFQYSVICTIPKEHFNDFISGQPYETKESGYEQEGETYSIRFVSENDGTRTLRVHYTVKNGAGSKLTNWINQHGANSTTLPFLGYGLAVIVVFILIVFPYGKFKKKRIG